MGHIDFYIVSIARLAGAYLPEGAKVEPQQHQSVSDTCPGSNLHSHQAWLFQSNPHLYDLRGALHSLADQVWSVSRYAKEIRTGDRVYLWEAGHQGGIAGVAQITEPARLQPEPAEQAPFARVPGAFLRERLRTRLKILRVIEPLIPRRAVSSSAELNTLSVLRCARGTNFRLSVDQWMALNDLTQSSAAV